MSKSLHLAALAAYGAVVLDTMMFLIALFASDNPLAVHIVLMLSIAFQVALFPVAALVPSESWARASGYGSNVIHTVATVMLLNLPSGLSMTRPKKACEKDLDGLLPRHAKSYLFNERKEERDVSRQKTSGKTLSLVNHGAFLARVWCTTRESTRLARKSDRMGLDEEQ